MDRTNVKKIVTLLSILVLLFIGSAVALLIWNRSYKKDAFTVDKYEWLIKDCAYERTDSTLIIKCDYYLDTYTTNKVDTACVKIYTGKSVGDSFEICEPIETVIWETPRDKRYLTPINLTIYFKSNDGKTYTYEKVKLTMNSNSNLNIISKETNE